MGLMVSSCGLQYINAAIYSSISGKIFNMVCREILRVFILFYFILLLFIFNLSLSLSVVTIYDIRRDVSQSWTAGRKQ